MGRYSTVVGEQKKQTGSTVLVPVPNPENPDIGKLLRTNGDVEETSLNCRYSIGQDDVLTMMTEGKTLYAEERFWFASPNFRLRTNVLQQGGQLTMASLATEIRLGVT